MKTLNDCLDDITDDSYAISQTLIEFVDEDLTESVLRGIYNSYKLKDYKSVEIFAKSLAVAIDEALNARAQNAKDNLPASDYRADLYDHKRHEVTA